ncbi:hypothetical protein TNCV_1612031 [Trichonephila clavipes]|nr:hypothetical protein TNCV_1612031 [Trichonephila clavipes]
MHLSREKCHSRLCWRLRREAMYAETTDMRYMYSCANGNGATNVSCSVFLIDECRIVEFFTGYIVNFVKLVRSTSIDMMLMNEELLAVQAW